MNISTLRNYLATFKMPETAADLRIKGGLEYCHTYHELKSFIEAHSQTEILTDDGINDLIALLAKRWNRIKNPDSAYLQDTTNPANQLYSKIAADLENITGTSSSQLLMPTLQNEESSDHQQEIIEPPTKKRKVITEDNSQPEAVASSSNTVSFFRPHSSLTARKKPSLDANEYVKNYQLAQTYIENRRPLEALHYIYKALNNLNGQSHKDRWIKSRHTTLKELVRQAIKLFSPENNISLAKRIECYKNNLQSSTTYLNQGKQAIECLYKLEKDLADIYVELLENFKAKISAPQINAKR